MIIVFLSCDFSAQERGPSGGFSGREATGVAERPGRNNSTTSKFASNSNQGRATYDATSIRIFKHDQIIQYISIKAS